jgi:hypothetical protein
MRPFNLHGRETPPLCLMNQVLAKLHGFLAATTN